MTKCPKERGRIGGLRTSDLHGPEHSKERGRLGGEKTKRLYGVEHFKEAGRLGGLKVSQNREYMAALGRKGGKARGKSGE